MTYFLSIHNLSHELDRYFLFLIVRVSHFPILEKSFPQSYLVIRVCLQNNIIITCILKYFNNFPDSI